MYKKSSRSILPICLTVMLIFLLAFPVRIFAEGETPAIDPAATEPAALPDPQVGAGVDVSAPVVPQTEVAVAPIETQVAVIEATADPLVVIAEAPIVEEDIGDIVAALDEAEVVLVDEGGEPIPLASEKAVEALSASDPWFDAGGGVIVGYSSTGSCAAGVTECHSGVANPIQAAIDDARSGGANPIHVEAGLYTPTSTIWINKPLTLLGPQANVDPRTSCGTSRIPGDATTEAIVDGGGSLSTIFQIDSSDVTINGFEIRNATGDMIYAYPSAGTTFDNIYLGYNILHDSGDEAVQLRNVTGSTIEYNEIFDTVGDGINLATGGGSGSNNNTIAYNELYDINSDNAAIYLYGTTNTTIAYNTLYNITKNDGIKMGNKGGGDSSKSGGMIFCNKIYNVRQDGITVYMSDVDVICNEIWGSTSENGAIYVSFNVKNVLITDNYIYDNDPSSGFAGTTYGIRIGKSSYKPTNVVVTNNNIVNNEAGVYYQHSGGTNLLAVGNWWGSADGPSGAGPGSGDSVTTMVDFAPWLTVPVEISPCEYCDTQEEDPGKDKPPSSTPVLPADLILGPLGIIQVTSGQLVELSFDVANTLSMANGSSVAFGQTMGGFSAKLSAETSGTLPAALPSGYTFASGLTLNLMKGTETIQKLDSGQMTLQFTVPAGMEGKTFTILFWDAAAGKYVEVTGVSVAGGLVQVTIDQPGTYILVTK